MTESLTNNGVPNEFCDLGEERVEMSALESLEAHVREKIEKEGMTHAKLSVHLCEVYPGVKGFSVRSLERFCADMYIILKTNVFITSDKIVFATHLREYDIARQTKTANFLSVAPL